MHHFPVKVGIIKSKTFFIALLFFFLFPCKGYSRQDSELYCQGIKAARLGKADFAFMYFRMLLADFPESEFTEKALFAVGEYYFSLGDYQDAFRVFARFANSYPQSKARLFASAYYLELARKDEKKQLAKEIEKEIIVYQQLSFLFRDFKEYKYKSLLFNSYTALYFINRIEFYINEELFTKILY